MEEKVICPVCGMNDIPSYQSYDPVAIFYKCPVCGRYEITENVILGKMLDLNRLRPYLFYNCFVDKEDYSEHRFYTTWSKEKCDEFVRDKNYNPMYSGRPVHIDNDIVSAWYPKSFSEKIDLILLKLNELTGYVGGTVSFSKTEFISCMFVDQYDKNKTNTKLKENELLTQACYYADYLNDCDCIEWERHTPPLTESILIKLTAEGYKRVDELQRDTGFGRNALVAMKFGDDTVLLRESIKRGIRDAGYNPILIDEVEHNNLITPELLSHIRHSRFVVVDLTHQNNGAYFEEGYAMGLGKPVIQLCKKDTKLHFDIAQKNTIIWNEEDDIPLRLTNRIKATIE